MDAEGKRQAVDSVIHQLSGFFYARLYLMTLFFKIQKTQNIIALSSSIHIQLTKYYTRKCHPFLTVKPV